MNQQNRESSVGATSEGNMPPAGFDETSDCRNRRKETSTTLKRWRMIPGTRQALLDRIPTGFRNKAQGCEGRATLGKGGRYFTTPTGLRLGCAAVAVGHNPFRVVIDQTHDPRVARSSQPWALLRNPFGIRRRRRFGNSRSIRWLTRVRQ